METTTHVSKMVEMLTIMDFVAPVLVWIHGGGFTFGHKKLFGNPAGLIARSQFNGHDGVVVVSINYRLGMFGFLGSDIMPNIGLLDQKHALDWVQAYIPIFGGNNNRTTVMGESAGAASIVHHITAYDEGYPAPFQQAIPLSPGFQINVDQVEVYDAVLKKASELSGKEIEDIKGAKDLREWPFEQLRNINQAVSTEAIYGTFGFGPTPDGRYIRDLPQAMLYYSNIDLGIKVSAYLANPSYSQVRKASLSAGRETEQR